MIRKKYGVGRNAGEQMRYDKMNHKQMASSFVVDMYGGHQVYCGRYNYDDYTEIWTQIGSDEESPSDPAANIRFYHDRVVVIEDEEHEIMYGDFNLTSKKGFDKMCDVANNILDNYYGQFIEQPRFIRKGK